MQGLARVTAAINDLYLVSILPTIRTDTIRAGHESCEGNNKRNKKEIALIEDPPSRYDLQSKIHWR